MTLIRFTKRNKPGEFYYVNPEHVVTVWEQLTNTNERVTMITTVTGVGPIAVEGTLAEVARRIVEGE